MPSAGWRAPRDDASARRAASLRPLRVAPTRDVDSAKVDSSSRTSTALALRVLSSPGVAHADTHPVLWGADRPRGGPLTLGDRSLEEVPLPTSFSPIRVSGWTSDGQRFVYQGGDCDRLPITTQALDLVSGKEVTIDVGFRPPVE